MRPRSADTIRARRQRRVLRAARSGRILPYLAGVTLLTALGGGILMRFLDHESFPTVGDGIWFALQTVTTVGYGDMVPGDAWGKVVASIVMVGGVTFISLTTATVVSAFVAGAQERAADEAADAAEAGRLEHLEALERVERRLAAIEEQLGR
jgi:voltage-gated potassium channel